MLTTIFVHKTLEIMLPRGKFVSFSVYFGKNCKSKVPKMLWHIDRKIGCLMVHQRRIFRLKQCHPKMLCFRFGNIDNHHNCYQ